MSSHDPAKCVVQLDQVTIGHHGRALLSPLSMCVDEGDFLGLVGPNGGGKTTLIARALAGEPSLLLLDEPTNGMDVPSEHSIMELIRKLHAEGTTVVLVSHALHNVINYVQRLAYINQGRDLFEIDALEAMLTDERLTHLYGHPVRIGQLAQDPGYRVVVSNAIEPGAL